MDKEELDEILERLESARVKNDKRTIFPRDFDQYGFGFGWKDMFVQWIIFRTFGETSKARAVIVTHYGYIIVESLGRTTEESLQSLKRFLEKIKE